MTSYNKRNVGSSKEESACTFLKSKGVRIRERNFQIRQGEIDIIGYDKNVLVFFEVKFRKKTDAGRAEEAVSVSKQRQISKTALFYIAKKRIPMDTAMRFDVIAINGNEINWIKNAFPFTSNLRSL